MYKQDSRLSAVLQPCAEPLDIDANLTEIASRTPLQELSWQVAAEQGVRVLVKREDLLHPIISGNKFYKLYYHLRRARQLGFSRLVSFGGAYSNHLHALAAAGYLFNFDTVGLVRGELGDSPTLADVRQWGMQLEGVPRDVYRRRADEPFLAALAERFPASLIIPEGGGGIEGALGCRAIVESLDTAQYDYVCLPIATGTTMAGLICGMDAGCHVLGYSVLKGDDTLTPTVSYLLDQLPVRQPRQSFNWSVVEGFHCGGYAKTSAELVEFMAEFTRETGVPVDPVYTGKLFLALKCQLQAGRFPRGTTLVAIHTGGLQGGRGYIVGQR